MVNIFCRCWHTWFIQKWISPNGCSISEFHQLLNHSNIQTVSFSCHVEDTFPFDRADWRFERNTHGGIQKTDTCCIYCYMTSSEGCISFWVKILIQWGDYLRIQAEEMKAASTQQEQAVIINSRRAQNNYNWWIGALEKHSLSWRKLSSFVS